MWFSLDMFFFQQEQQSKLTAMLETKNLSHKELSKENDAKLKIMAMKSQQDSNIVKQLKDIVADKESKVHQLEDDIRQLKINVSNIFRTTGNYVKCF